jgi:putative sterol carrier protein
MDMAKQFPSQEWFEALQEKLTESEAYGEEAAGWGVDFNGDFVFTIEEGDGLAESAHYLLEVEDGDCHDVYPVDIEESDHGFELVGSYPVWKQVVKDELDPIDGIMGGDLKLNGDMQQVLRYQDSADTLVSLCTEIDTEFV